MIKDPVDMEEKARNYKLDYKLEPRMLLTPWGEGAELVIVGEEIEEIKEKINTMSNETNTLFLEQQYEVAEQAVALGDEEALLGVYITLNESGFEEEAEDLRQQFGTLGV